ncbi:MAG: PVC-type heme-binding CxxCH protein, partial [Planctomycetota bacterium]
MGAPPNLMFLPDRDSDDQADRDAIEVRLTGWGIRDRHETLNSLHWGPDGWLYGLQGYATPSTVGKPAGSGKVFRGGEPYPDKIAFDGATTEINGGVWRYHPTKERFEVVAHGFSNPWGIDYDANGQLFITACVIPHLWHVIPGGIYHRQGGTHFNPHVYDDIKTIADHRHRSAHGGARVYLSDAFPKKYRNRIFMANIHEHAVLTDILKPKGSGFVGVHGDDFLKANNAQWVGFSVEIGPEGNVYVLDWHDADICGADVLNKETGRIFRISPKQSAATDFAGRSGDLNQLSDSELVQLQTSESSWHARRARVILQSRATERAINPLAVAELNQQLNAVGANSLRLRAMWSLHLIGQLTTERLQEALSDPAPYVRGWAIQLLCEDFDPPQRALEQMTAMAGADPSPVVRLYVAAAVQRIPEAKRLPVLRELAANGVDAVDHNLPKMIWFGLEPLVTKYSDQCVELALASQIPMVTRHIARRLADDDQLDRVTHTITDAANQQETYRESVVRDAKVSPHKAVQLMLGLRDSLEGRFDVEAPIGWQQAVKAITSRVPDAVELAGQLSQQFGDRQIAQAMLARIGDSSATVSQRAEAIRGLAAQRHPELPSKLVRLMDSD